jgi:hypothetical protein
MRDDLIVSFLPPRSIGPISTSYVPLVVYCAYTRHIEHYTLYTLHSTREHSPIELPLSSINYTLDQVTRICLEAYVDSNSEPQPHILLYADSHITYLVLYETVLFYYNISYHHLQSLYLSTLYSCTRKKIVSTASRPTGYPRR